MRARSVIIALCGLVTAGCDASPKEPQARAWYASNQSALKQLTSDLSVELSGLPYVVGSFACGREKALSCLHQQTAWIERANQHEREVFDRIHPLFDGTPSLVGLHIELERPDDPLTGEVLQSPERRVLHFGVHNANKKGAVEPGSGFDSEGFQVGWGLGQASCSKGAGSSWGDASYHEQFDVMWSFSVAPSKVRVTAHFMPSSSPSKEWFDHCLHESQRRI